MKFLLFYLILILICINITTGKLFGENEDSSVFENTESSDLTSETLKKLNFDNTKLDETTFENDNYSENSQSNSISNDLSTTSRSYQTIGELMAKKEPEKFINSNQPRNKIEIKDDSLSYSKFINKNKRSQKTMSIKNFVKEYSKEELNLLNEFYLAFALLIRKGFKKFFFKKYKPSHIRSVFAEKFQERFGGSKSSALIKLRQFERKLSLKHSAAKKLFKSQINILKSTLHSFQAIIHLSQKWRHQPTYVNDPILIVNKKSYNKLYSIFKKKSKKIDIFLITASPERIPKKYRKPDINESYSNISNLYDIIQNIQDSVAAGQTDLSFTSSSTMCEWKSSRKRAKGFKSKLFCFLKPKNNIFHIHYYDVSNITLFNHLILNLIKYKPNIGVKTARALILIPVLLGIPEINEQGSILGLNSITEVNKKRNFKKSKSKSKKRSKRRKKK